MTQLCWPAPERNKEPIATVLARVLPSAGSVLEIGSGSGQHVVHFARRLPGLTFQPSDPEEDHLASIRAWIAGSDLTNVRSPLQLDVRAANWNVAPVDAIFSANMVHIAPWECALALFSGAARHLRPAGRLVLYGPFHVDGHPTAPSNAAFDQDLRRRDPSWGVRDLSDIVSAAEHEGLTLLERVQMPANNLTLVFRRAEAPSGL